MVATGRALCGVADDCLIVGWCSASMLTDPRATPASVFGQLAGWHDPAAHVPDARSKPWSGADIHQTRR